MKINPQIKETTQDGTPYRVAVLNITAQGVRDERLLANIADKLSRLSEVRFTKNTIRIKAGR